MVFFVPDFVRMQADWQPFVAIYILRVLLRSR